jgi:dephospho-CoA kinase
MNRIVVGLAGLRGSGKTTISRTLEERYAFVRTSFGDYVRLVAKSKQMNSDICSLENLGHQLIEELGWSQFCRKVLAGTERAERVVVDGIRHLAAISSIRSLIAPAYFSLVFVETEDSIRIKRLLARDGSVEAGLTRKMTHEIKQLKGESDFIVDGSTAKAADAIISWARSGGYSNY